MYNFCCLFIILFLLQCIHYFFQYYYYYYCCWYFHYYLALCAVIQLNGFCKILTRYLTIFLFLFHVSAFIYFLVIFLFVFFFLFHFVNIYMTQNRTKTDGWNKFVQISVHKIFIYKFWCILMTLKLNVRNKLPQWRCYFEKESFYIQWSWKRAFHSVVCAGQRPENVMGSMSKMKKKKEKNCICHQARVHSIFVFVCFLFLLSFILLFFFHSLWFTRSLSGLTATGVITGNYRIRSDRWSPFGA